MPTPTTLPQTPEIRVSAGTRRWLARQLFPAPRVPEPAAFDPANIVVVRIDHYLPGQLDAWSNTISAFILAQARVAATPISATQIDVRAVDLESFALEPVENTKVIIGAERYNLSSVAAGSPDMSLYLGPYTEVVLPIPP
jgi:hypothetical protein